jgi:CubicO group peptidase (beta-lactamase class C family)
MKVRWRPLKWLLVAAGGLLALLVAALALVVAWEWTYIDRMRHFPSNLITDVAWYRPVEAVPGGGGEPLPRAAPGAVGLSAGVLEEAAELADAKNASALLVARGGKVALERYWRGHRPGGPTNSASMAKGITSLLVGIAVGEGTLPSLDAPAATWIPAWRADARRKITLRHLLQMHSGLRPMGTYDEPFSDASYLALGTDMRYVVDNVPAVAEPGTRFDYNNVNYQALGFVLEAATGRRFAAYLSEKLWRPLGCADARVWLDREGGSAHASGFLFAGPDDWAKVGLMLLHQGEWDGRQVVPRDYFKELTTPSPTEPVYALGVWLANDEHQVKEEEQTFLSPGIFYLDGHSKQRVYVVPREGLVVVRVGENGRRWDEAALPNAVVRAARAEDGTGVPPPRDGRAGGLSRRER